MKWTKEVPTVDGYYWWRLPSGDYLLERDSGEFYETGNDMAFTPNNPLGLFQGPITPDDTE